MEVTQSLGEVVGAGSLADIVFGSLEVTLLECEHAEVCKDLRTVGVDGLRLVEPLACLGEVALLPSQCGEVVVGADVLRILTDGLLEDSLLLGGIVGERGGIEHLLDAEL